MDDANAINSLKDGIYREDNYIRGDFALNEEGCDNRIPSSLYLKMQGTIFYTTVHNSLPCSI